MSRVAHIRMYPTDWRSGCMGLSLEQEGLYIRMCMFMAETGRRVPLDDTEAARMINVQTRNYRRVVGELLRLGKITRHDNGYGNSRVEHERSEAENAAGRKSTAKTEGGTDRDADSGPERQDCAATADLTPNYSRSNSVVTPLAAEIATQNQCASIEPVTTVVVVGDRTRAMKIIVDAAKPILRDRGMSAGLMATASEIDKWLKADCDLVEDILPAIAAAVAKGKIVSSWTFFSQAIVDAKAKREAPLPQASPPAAGQKRADGRQKRTINEILAERQAARAVAEGVPA